MRRTGRFDARRLLTAVDGVSMGVSGLFGGSLERDLARDQLHRLAYPTGRDGPPLALVQTPEKDS